MKKLSVFLSAMVLMFGVVGPANSALQTIGTATYMGSDYNLIYEDDSINGGLVWLDYTKGFGYWQNQVDWASGLNTAGVLTYTLNSGVSVTWGDDWRLPITDESQCNLSGGLGYEGPDASGYHNYKYGYNMVNSELGHLYYTSLGNLGYQALNGTSPQPGYGLENTGPFNELEALSYWSGTKFANNPDSMWTFHYFTGFQNYFVDQQLKSLAVRDATVSAVPIPSAIWLFGSGLIGIVGFRRKFRKS